MVPTILDDDGIKDVPQATEIGDDAASSANVVKRVQVKATVEGSKDAIVKPGTSTTRLAARKDAPIVISPVRGSLKRAMAAGMASRKKQTLAALQRDEVAPSGWAPGSHDGARGAGCTTTGLVSRCRRCRSPRPPLRR